MPSDFIHLHLHSHYSYLDGISKIKQIVAKTVEFDQPAVALTDHGNMFGVMELFHATKDAGVKPIYGTEVYIAENNLFEHKKGEKRFHLVLLAKDIEGYKNLVRLSSAGFLDGFYYKPRIDKELLREHSKGLVAMSACLSGEIPWMIHEKNEKGLADALDYYVDVFGKDNFFLEVQNHGLPDQLPINKRLVELARKTGLGLVATNDSHYVNKGDNTLQEIMFCIRDKTTLDNPDRFKYDSPEFYIKSPDEMAAIFAELPEAISNTRRVADMCEVDLGAYLKGKDHLPRYPLPGNETADSYLTKLCRQGLTERFKSDIPENYETRLKSELELISQMGFSNYFLVVSDFVRYARRNGILVGPGRGSAAGAIVSYALRITNIDPIKYDLLFERFLNPERVTMPDIDIDFEDERRDEVKEYIRSAYGYKKTSDIITFGVLQAKAALKDVGRVLDIPYEEVNKVTGLIPGKLALNNSLPELLELVPNFGPSSLRVPRFRKNGSIIP
jgi:DNA polymerase-3 subunit alpha